MYKETFSTATKICSVSCLTLYMTKSYIKLEFFLYLSSSCVILCLESCCPAVCSRQSIKVLLMRSALVPCLGERGPLCRIWVLCVWVNNLLLIKAAVLSSHAKPFSYAMEIYCIGTAEASEKFYNWYSCPVIIRVVNELGNTWYIVGDLSNAYKIS